MIRNLKLKVCGMRDPHNIAEVAALAPDYMGFIFYEKSPRYAGNLAPEVVYILPSSICRVGVFVNASQEEIETTVRKYRLDRVQLHGAESPELCNALRKVCPVVKAISVRDAADVQESTRRYEGAVDYLLFDTKTPLYGGSGEQFDWSSLDSYDGGTEFFLSGGIGLDDAQRLHGLDMPLLHAVDINSRFETEPGVKDTVKLERFFRELGRL